MPREPLAAPSTRRPDGAAPAWLRALGLLYCAGLFLGVPLAVAPSALRTLRDVHQAPYVYFTRPKTVAVIATLAIGLIACLAAWMKGVRLPRPRSLGAWCLCVLGLALLALIGYSASHSTQDRSTTLWGTPLRMDGALPQVLWVLLVPLSALVVSVGQVSRAAIVRTAVLGAALVSAWTIDEACMHEEPASWFAPLEYGGSPGATLGNPGLVSGYLAVVLVVLGASMLARVPVLGKALSVAALALLGAGIAASGERAGGLAAVVVLGSCSVIALARRYPRALAVLLAAAVTAGCIAYLASPSLAMRWKAFSSNPPAGVAGLKHRFNLWRMGVRASLARPLTGYGPDAFGSHVWQFASPEEEQDVLAEFVPDTYIRAGMVERNGNVVYTYDPTEKTEVIDARGMNLDKVHNYYVDFALQDGWPAVTCFLAFVALALWRALRAEAGLTRSMGLGVAAYLVFGMAWFATPAIDPVIWGILGMALAAPRREVDS